MSSGKSKTKTKASKEPMRWADDGSDADGPVFREPTAQGNTYDIQMSEEADGVLAAKKIVGHIQQRGACVCQANAPAQLLDAAYYEASELWQDGAFAPPLRVHDDRSMLEAQLWGQALTDEEKVVWIRETGPQSLKGMNALKLLAKNMSDFAGGLGQLLKEDMGIDYDRVGNAMLSCYTGDRRYALHLDNAHSEGEDGEGGSLPDNGMRLSCTYFLNPHWEFEEGNQGGLDVLLTDPSSAPGSASGAKRAPRLRVAPTADTLVMFLSERMAHQVIQTRGKDQKWFALTVWGLCGTAMQQMSKKLLAMRQPKKEDSDEDDVD